MVTTSVEGIIAQRIDLVFSFMRNLETMKDYNFSIRKSQWSSDAKNSADISINLSVIQLDGLYKIQEEIPNQKFVCSFGSSSVSFVDTYRFEKVSEKETRVFIEDRMELKGLLKFSEFLVGGFLKDGMEKNLKSLQSILEKME